MKRHRVDIAAPAREQIRAISEWWRENRQDRPELFKDELRRAVALLKAVLWAGPAHPSPLHRDVRRTLLRRTKQYVYDVVDEVDRVVTIVAVWHTARGTGPPL